MELRNPPLSRADLVLKGGMPHRGRRCGEASADVAESENLSMSQHSNRENLEIPSVSPLTFDWERSANFFEGVAGRLLTPAGVATE